MIENESDCFNLIHGSVIILFTVATLHYTKFYTILFNDIYTVIYFIKHPVFAAENVTWNDSVEILLKSACKHDTLTRCRFYSEPMSATVAQL